MTTGFVQSKSTSGYGSSPSVVLDAAPTAGNLLVIFYAYDVISSGVVTAFQDFQDLSPDQALSVIDNTAGTVRLRYGTVGAGQSATLTMTTQFSTPYAILAVEYAGAGRPSPLDTITSTSSTGGATGTTSTGPSITPDTSSQKLLIGGMVLSFAGSGAKTSYSNEQINSSTTGVTERLDVLAYDDGGSTKGFSMVLFDKIVASPSGTYDFTTITHADNKSGAGKGMFLASFYLGLARVVDGTQPEASGTASRIYHGHRTNTGTQPSASGAISRLRNRLYTLTGTEPAATGVVSRLRNRLYTLTGTQPSFSGVCAAIRLLTSRVLDGTQPQSSGFLAVGAHLNHYTTPGSQPAASGALVVSGSYHRTIAGTQPAATGEGRPRYSWTSTVAGLQPAMSGNCHYNSPPRSDGGTQPAGSGTISWIKYHLGKRIVSADATPLNN